DLSIDLAAANHIAVQGITRSGKSMLATQIIAFAVQHPNINVSGIDPSGLLLGEIRNTVNGTEHLTDAALLLESLVTEMDDRIRTLRRSGNDKLDSYTPTTPLLLVVLEELPGLLATSETIDKNLAVRI